MLTVERLNYLYWEVLYEIEPCLRSHVPPPNEPISEMRSRLEIEASAQRKATAIMALLKGAELLGSTVSFIPSRVPPFVGGAR